MKTYSVRQQIASDIRNTFVQYSDIVAHLLAARGILTNSEAEEFLNPSYEKGVHDPFLYRDMDKAVERIICAIRANEKIAIFSDYDADGIPGAVVMHDFFTRAGFKNFIVYIPHRHDEGFGLNSEAVDELADAGVKLVITIDCGIADIEEVKHFNDKNINVIITDHHLATVVDGKEKLPPAFAILDAKREGDEYPYKMLCGAGVAFKLVTAILSKERFGIPEGHEKWLLDMVGLATLADMVPLVGENRVFASYGLKVLRKSPRPGLRLLLRELGVNQNNLNEEDVGFSIVPRINAASRMGAPEDAYNVLIAEDESKASGLVKHLNKINDERKGVVASMLKEAKKVLAQRNAIEKKIIVMGNPEWRPSLLGLVANNLAEEHSCPVFLWGRDGGENIKGSCRSGGGASIIEIMENAKEVFLEFGGHAMSGGFSVDHEHVHLLEGKLLDAVEKISCTPMSKEEMVDCALVLDNIDSKFFTELEKLAPFGVGNERPMFMFHSVTPVAVKQFGKEKNHLELEFKKTNGKSIKAIGFFMKPEDFSAKIEVGLPINLVATLEKSTFRGFTEYRLRIVDVA